MDIKISYLKDILIFLLIFILAPSVSWAYLDPGTGSFIIQILVATVVGTLVTIKMYWSKIIGIFKKKSENETEIEMDDSKEE